MVMSVQFAEQYKCACIRHEGGETFEEVEDLCSEAHALYWDGEEYCLVLQFPGRPQELYTEEAARRSLEANPHGEPK